MYCVGVYLFMDVCVCLVEWGVRVFGEVRAYLYTCALVYVSTLHVYGRVVYEDEFVTCILVFYLN